MPQEVRKVRANAKDEAKGKGKARATASDPKPDDAEAAPRAKPKPSASKPKPSAEEIQRDFNNMVPWLIVSGYSTASCIAINATCKVPILEAAGIPCPTVMTTRSFTLPAKGADTSSIGIL